MSREIEIVKGLNKGDDTQGCKSALCRLYLRDVVGCFLTVKMHTLVKAVCNPITSRTRERS